MTCNLIGLSAILFSGTLSRQSLLHSALRARLQVEGVTLHFFNDVFRLNLALEPTKGILDRLTLLQSNFRQTHHPQTKTNRTYLSLLHLTAPRRTECQTTRWSQCLRKCQLPAFRRPLPIGTTEHSHTATGRSGLSAPRYLGTGSSTSDLQSASCLAH